MQLNLISIVRSIAYSMLLSFCLLVAESIVPANSQFTNTVEAKSAKSPYKKSFKRSVRISSKRSRSSKKSRSGSCILWDANRINDKAGKFKSHINEYARLYRIDRDLIKAIITAESCFRVKAKSHKGAQGLMQLIPATAKRFGVKNSFKPKQNIRGGTKYLRFLMNKFNGDLKKVIASYNAGEGAVVKYKGIPPYKETKQYVKNVLKVYAALSPRGKYSNRRVNAVYKTPMRGKKAGRQGWQYNRSLAPHLYKQ